MTKQFWAALVVIVLILVGVFVIADHKNASAPTSSVSGVTEHIEGQGKAGVTLVEYGDYQCPACGEYYEPLKEVFAKYSSQIYFQFRNFPLTNLHPNAFAGARAAEAAAMQGKYWQMHDVLYEQNMAYYTQNVQNWIPASNPLPFFDSYAKQIGLNVTEFNKDFESDKVNNAINADIAEGNKLNITGTPTFFLDGKEISNPDPTLQAFSQVLDKAIAQKTGKKPSSPSSSSSTNSTQTPAPAQTKGTSSKQ